MGEGNICGRLREGALHVERFRPVSIATCRPSFTLSLPLEPSWRNQSTA